MKKRFAIPLTAMLLCAVMLFSSACAANGAATPSSGDPSVSGTEHPANGARKIVPATVKLYHKADDFDEIAAAHYEGCSEILLIDTATMYQEFFDGLLGAKGPFTYEETETTLTIKRANGAYCTFDFVEDSLEFNNFDLFTAYGYGNMADLLDFPYTDAEGNSFYFSRTDSLDIAGLPIYIDFAERNIPLDIYGGKKYIPFQTFNDIFLSPFCYNVAYNGQDLFMAAGGALDASVTEQYYSVEPAERSKELTEFAANELCLLLDLFYGLQDEHGVLVGFETFMEHTGLWEDLTSPDAGKAGAALASLTFGYLADQHSAVTMASPYTGHSTLQEPITISQSFLQYLDYCQEIQAARAEMMPDGVAGYLEVGNTAYVTFDTFTISPTRAPNKYDENAQNTDDTFGLIIYAHSMITRENSPIENVVLDLSCNGGGAVDAGFYVAAWMLGYCHPHVTNPITNSYATAGFKADVNLDGVFDEKDSVADKNLYCLISPASFSCGNLVPSLFKESGKVTLLGNTSGGGACSVQPVSMADGTLFQISSPHHLAAVSNGAYYTIDRGIEPHHYFGKFESYFDRQALTAYINGLK